MKKKSICLYSSLALLAVYGVFTTLQNRRLEIRVGSLEKHLAGVAALQASDFTVSITKDREVEVQGAKMSLQELRALISGIPDKKEKTVLLIVPKDADLKLISAVMNSCREFGFTKFHLLNQPTV